MDYLAAVIESAIKSGQYREIDRWMCAIGRMNIDVRPFLNMIAESPQAVLSYFEKNSQTLSHRRLSNEYWELPCEGHDAIVDWFYLDQIRRIPFEAYGFEF
jgi:hypothetical protein